MTGFFARYFKSWESDQPRFQWLSAFGKATLRDALRLHRPLPHKVNISLEADENVRHVVGEMSRCGLWNAQNRVLNIDSARVATVFSASKNQFFFGDDSNNRVLDLFRCSPESFAREIAQKIGARGPRISPVAACATGAHCIAIGAQQIEDGYADVAICGAIEPVLSPLVLAVYDNMGALSKSHLMRPFDQKRDGFVPNSGAGCLVLEKEEKARSRGAEIFGYVSGWAMNADATHMTAMCPSGSSIARAIEYSMRRANVQTVDYINAHGTATKLNDETEARGICSVLGNKVPVSSTKPLTGHLLGAAGAVEAVISLLALRENFAPPTLNLENIDASCDLDLVVGKGREIEMQSVLSLNYGFGGHLGALLFTKN